MTKQEIMENDYPHIQNFDYALPQGLVNAMQAVTDEHVPAHFVMNYEDPDIFGKLFPITTTGERILVKWWHYNEHQ